MDLPFLSAIPLPKPLSVSSSHTRYSTQYCFWPRDSFYRQWSMLMGSFNEEPVSHQNYWSSWWWERDTGSKVSSWIPICLHKLFALVASKFVFYGSPSLSCILGYHHGFQFISTLPTPCPSFLPGRCLWWLNAQY